MLITVGICCNDDRGRTDLLTALYITDKDGEEILDLRSDFNVGEEISISGLHPEIELAVGGKVYWAITHGSWVGNINWDSVEMELGQATRLVNDLLALDHWCVFGAECELAQAIEDERYITGQQLKRALS